MHKKKLHITLFTLLIWSFSFAQQYTHYTTKSGLPSNHIYTILQDAKGFIWFLTDKGMVKYNGKTFKTFTTKQGLPNNDAWEGFTTPDTKVWYLSKSSKLGYIENDSVFSFATSNEGEIMNPICSSQIKNNVYPTGPTNTFELKNGKWTKKINHNDKNVDKIAIFHNTITCLKINILQDTLKIIGAKDLIIKKCFIKPFFRKFAKRKQLNDSLYCWVSEKDYLILNLNNLKLTHSSYKNEVRLEKVKHARINIVNNQIQITGTGFVGFLDKKFHIKNPYFFPKKINAHFALIDKNKTIWLATFSNGVYKLPYVKQEINYKLTTKNTGKFSVINNTVFINVSNKGYYKYNRLKKDFELFLNVKNFPFKAIEIKELNTSFFPSNFKISTLKNNHLKTIDYQKLKSLQNPLGSQFIYFNKNLYSLFSFGINKINPIDLTIKKAYLQAGINYLYVFNNKLLVATSNGLKEFKNDTIKKVNFSNQIFDKSILSLNKISNSELLLNTDGFGSFITNLKTIKQLPKSKFLTVENAFIENNNIWLATNEGVFKYIKSATGYKLTKKFDVNNGLPSNTINDILIKKNKIFASTNNGIAILPKNQKSPSQFITIYIDKAFYNKNKITNKKAVFKYKKDNNATFSISSINYDENNKNFSYQYKLNPVQKKWITTKSNNLNFTDLPPNKYKLSVTSHGVTNSINFKILPLWYQTNIAKIIFVLLFLALTTGIILMIRKKELNKQLKKLNTQKQLSEFELHALRSQMNPHFVFNSLNAIQYFITKNDIELSEKYLVKFSRLIRKFFDFSRTKFISLEQEVSLLKNYLEIEKMRFGEQFNFQFNIDENLNLSEEKIPSMLLQPIVENAVNHGLFHNEGNGLIKIDFLKNEDLLIVQISDNGVGLKKAQEIKENSIKTHISKSNSILKDRISLLNQSKEWFIIYSINELKNSNGTIVKLTFKHNEN
ncbi:histidine kinase [Lutibacter sp.]|uniref:sensor histidine kinase n=1 Tax=Lutibacter sp. TaxID=1925666 RepID=UPI0025B98C39|nr:histidine kinase [Lutibacter sp.]MCF6181611.1 histidine kinase [Lutibacter sp.]